MFKDAPNWAKFTGCDTVTCEEGPNGSPGPRNWEITWRREDSYGDIREETTRECGTHALDTRFDQQLGTPVAIRAL